MEDNEHTKTTQKVGSGLPSGETRRPDTHTGNHPPYRTSMCALPYPPAPLHRHFEWKAHHAKHHPMIETVFFAFGEMKMKWRCLKAWLLRPCFFYMRADSVQTLSSSGASAVVMPWGYTVKGEEERY